MNLQLLPFPAADYATWRAAQVERRRRWQFGPLWSDDDAATVQARAAVDDLAPADGLSGTYLHRVLGPGGDAGWLWLSRQDGDLLVLDAEIDAPAEALLALLEARARAADARQLVLDRMIAAPTTAALAELGAFTVLSQTMVLDLRATDTPGSDRVALHPMTQLTFDAYLAAAIDEYAHEIQRTDHLPWDEALDHSRADYDALLPQGLATPGQVLLDVVETATGETVGTLWLGLRPPSAAFVYDVYLMASARGRGLGRAAMLAGAAWCRERGIGVLGLSVFGRNTVARELYESLGYTVVMEALRHPVEPAPPVTGPR
ncbi:GCN5-related N-acetyltransferase [Xylanimonas cellulosilytica DSM 15894]|uniref:GCN5-related N-acetyltransferase n=1 Tax=Xylanimonas cellulosilytica (strain DSM 15894 / JCM 12276 / CECT 5975 / KCTC 9989 / LMG 20990 / NBRC 107835 / XIL07) TaxID=446471 RepID=D1BZC4_XYLCX|nr:GNAT family N-acetyltransferase [Xylanimonas cellulosilytica]ACZ32021.1 GCN5-related N-acetyltransferase [Xylanimonas cellulosilytica DSM 15894]